MLTIMPGLTELHAASTTAHSPPEFISAIVSLLQKIRNVGSDTLVDIKTALQSCGASLLDTLTTLITLLPAAEADAIASVLEKTTNPTSYGGLGITTSYDAHIFNVRGGPIFGLSALRSVEPCESIFSVYDSTGEIRDAPNDAHTKDLCPTRAQPTP